MMTRIAQVPQLLAILAFCLPAAPSFGASNGIIPFGSHDPSVIFQSSLTSVAAIAAVSGGSVTGTPSFDSVNGMIPGAAGGAYFQGDYLGAQNAGQLTLEVETTLISEPSPDFAGGIGGSQGYDHTADGWQTLLDIHAADGTAIANLGLTSNAGIGGNYRGVNFVGLGVHSAGKSAFVRLTLSWAANTYSLYVDDLLLFSGSGAGLNIGQIAVGYSEPGIYGIKRYHIRNLILSSQPVTSPVDPSLLKVVIYGDSFASQANPFVLGSTNFDSTAGFQLLRNMNRAGMSIGQIMLKDYPGETLNRSPAPNLVSFQVGTNRFGGTADKLTDVVNADADYVIIMGGTNDAAGDAGARGAVAPSFAADLLSMCRTILNNPRTKGIVLQTIMSLKGNASFAAPTYVAYVSTINTMIRALPTAWDETYPGEQGKIKVVDVFTATGGESAAANMEKGTLTGALNDLHPTAFADVISGNLIAAALQESLATTGEVSVVNCVADQNGVILQPSATVTIDLGGAAPCSGYGRYDVTQSLTLNQPTLDVRLTSGFNPTAGSSFQILAWQTLSGTFGSVSLPLLPGGLSWDSAALYTTGTIDVLKPAPPTISVTAGADQSIIGGNIAAPVDFTVAGGDTLTVAEGSSNTALLPNAGVAVNPNFGSTTFSCAAILAVAPHQTGSATVTFTVADVYGQSGSASTTITVTKPAPPTIQITQGGNQSFPVGDSPVPVVFTVAGAAPLTVTETSNNPALLPNSAVSLSANCGTALPAACTANVNMAAGATGSAMVTLQAEDAYGQIAKVTAAFQVNLAANPSGGGGAIELLSLLGLASFAGLAVARRGTTIVRTPTIRRCG